MNKKKESKVVPNVRFKGFTDDWKQRKLGEVATFINGRAYSQDELQNSGKYKVLRVGNFYTNDSWYFSDMELDEKYYAKDGDLLYTWSATFGPHIWHGDKVIYHYHIWKVELSNILEKRFAVQLLEQDKDKILSDKNGSTMVHITKSGMEQKKALLPPNIKEQANIGEYFSSIDRLITLHQQKITLLTKLKKAILEKMFPKKGSVIPEFRFNGFANAWEQQKISDVSKITTGGTPSTKVSEYWNPGEIPWLSSGEVHKKYIAFTDNMISRTGMENSSARMVQENSVLIALAGQGKTRGTVAINRIPLTTNQSLAAMTFDNTMNPEFVFSNLEIRYDELRSISSGDGSRGGLNKQLIGNIIIPRPSLEEQIKIGEFFKDFNNLITLHKRKIDMLKKLKSACLSEMFI